MNSIHHFLQTSVHEAFTNTYTD